MIFRNRWNDYENQLHLEEEISEKIERIEIVVIKTFSWMLLKAWNRMLLLWRNYAISKRDYNRWRCVEANCSRNHRRECKAYKISLGQLNKEVENLRLALKSHASGLTYIAACVGKVNPTWESLYDLFIDLQESVIPNNNTTSERIGVLTKQWKEGNVTSENDMKALDQSPNIGVGLTQQANQMNEVLKRDASLHADENVPSEAKQQGEDPICHTSSHFSKKNGRNGLTSTENIFLQWR